MITQSIYQSYNADGL